MSRASPTYYWHDYETWGTDPRSDRPAQFGGIRTDLELNVVGEPLLLYCKPANDCLPQPDACLVTGITPQRALDLGVCEAEFIALIHEQLAQPATCGVGYNSLRFDDEVTRFALYRNFFDPYAREWQNGNSRWDIIDVVRLTRALRPEGVAWPMREDGSPSFRLEELTAANGIEHAEAHDALADVHATIAVTKLVRARQPRLYAYAAANRDKVSVSRLLDLPRQPLLLHVSRRIPARLGCISPVVALAAHPRNRNSVIVFDLRHDPEPLLDLEPEAVRERLYTAASDLEEGEERVGLKEVHLNKCPVLAPVRTLTGERAQEWGIDLAQADARRRRLLAAAGLRQKLEQVFAANPFPPAADPDQGLYDGFFSDADRQRIDLVRRSAPERLASLGSAFDDPRLPELLLRYRARNWPDSLTAQERAEWERYRLAKLSGVVSGASSITLAEYRARIKELAADPSRTADELQLLEELQTYAQQLVPGAARGENGTQRREG